MQVSKSKISIKKAAKRSKFQFLMKLLKNGRLVDVRSLLPDLGHAWLDPISPTLVGKISVKE
jgi:hypothetical protein